MTLVLEPPSGGACVGETEIFFPYRLRNRALYDAERRAKRICSSCDLLAECREYGLNHELYGVWGGMTERERERERRRLGIVVKLPMRQFVR